MATEQNVPSIDDAPSQLGMDSKEVQDHLDAWAQDDSTPAGQAKPRNERGEFVSPKGEGRDFKDASKMLKQTMRSTLGNRKVTIPDDDEEEAQEVETQERQETEEEEKPAPRRKVKGIVNGQEEEIDLDDEEFQKVNAVQAMRAAQRAWREAAQMRKESNQLRQALEVARQNVQRDPMSLFKALGVPEESVLQFAQQATIDKLAETIDPNTGQPYTPEQQRIIQLQNELKRRELTEKEMQEKQQLQEQEQLKDVIRKDVDRKFTAALQQTGLPPTQYTMMRLADLMQSVGPEVDPSQVAPLVLEDIVNEVRHTLYSMPVDVAVAMLGDDFMQELRKYDIQQARQSKDKFGRNPSRYPNNSQQRAPERNTQRITRESEAQDWLEKWAER